MNIDCLITFGCSHSVYNYFNKTSYTDIISEKYNCTFYNYSEEGNSNENIFHTVVERLEEYKFTYRRYPSHVVVQWSHPCRKLYVETDGSKKFITPHDSPELGLKWEPVGTYQTINYQYILQEYFKINKIKYVMWNFFNTNITPPNEKLIDKSKFIKPEFGYESFFDYIRENNLARDEHGHPNVEGHEYLGMRIIKKFESYEYLH